MVTVGEIQLLGPRLLRKPLLSSPPTLERGETRSRKPSNRRHSYVEQGGFGVSLPCPLTFPGGLQHLSGLGVSLSWCRLDDPFTTKPHHQVLGLFFKSERLTMQPCLAGNHEVNQGGLELILELLTSIGMKGVSHHTQLLSPSSLRQNNFFFLYLFKCSTHLRMFIHVYHTESIVEVRGQFAALSSLPTLWVPGIKL